MNFKRSISTRKYNNSSHKFTIPEDLLNRRPPYVTSLSNHTYVDYDESIGGKYYFVINVNV